MSAHFLEYATLAVSVAGLAAVLAEIVVKDARLLPAIIRNAREIAAPAKDRLRGTNVAFSHQTHLPNAA
ncbi:hypothetical protein HDIA_3379 [Hartmannibacter diazotrophicus]|uniref:Uncharacterized protein n=1 Tax=Hartmannibacter diazotrophicus TaxID=1482074 RepID=A0A2C9D9S4_9HYPH|nr:hypothetical protein [Hartmannibacter diazotrophicus]SON56920.1 hypothetical protein HDIA_3379 [Hartmannibacter diazotrophicus]